jgi:hypothetical protein
MEQLIKAGDFEVARVHERVKERILQIEQQRAPECAVFL